jgi:hypothetical protein
MYGFAAFQVAAPDRDQIPQRNEMTRRANGLVRYRDRS